MLLSKLVYFTVDSCPELQVPMHGSINTTLVVYGTYVNVSCDYGYNLPSGDTYKIVQCLSGSEWNDTVEECKCELDIIC